MSNGFGLRNVLMAIKRRVFISYHHDSDQWYYNEFKRFFAEGYETITDNSLNRLIDSENTDYVIRRIREKNITGTSCTIVLCGPQTRWRKYVDWEIKATLDKNHGLIGVKLPNSPVDIQGRYHKPDRLQDNVDTGYAVLINWEELNAGPEFLRNVIEIANNKSPILMSNNRALRKRNG